MTSHVAYSVETLREAAEYYTPASEVNPLLEWAADEIERLGTRISDCLSEQAEKNAMLNQAQEHAIDCGRITLEVQDRLYLLTNVEQYAVEMRGIVSDLYEAYRERCNYCRGEYGFCISCPGPCRGREAMRAVLAKNPATAAEPVTGAKADAAGVAVAGPDNDLTVGLQTPYLEVVNQIRSVAAEALAFPDDAEDLAGDMRYIHEMACKLINMQEKT